MLHVRSDAWFCERDGRAVVTVLGLAGTLATVFRRWVNMYEKWGFGHLHRGRAQNATIPYYPELTTLFYLRKCS